MAHIFISFVEENSKVAAWIVNQLRANGLDPWFSKDEGRIVAGDQWRETLREAIRNGGFYVPLFTKEWADRTRTVANEELTVAVEEARMRGLDRRWLVPVKLDQTPIRTLDLGAGRTLSDIHYVDFPQTGWERGLRSLLKSLGVENPIIEQGEPLAPGFGSVAEIVGGFVRYRNTKPYVAELDGTAFTVTGGHVRRANDGSIFARFELQAPFEELQRMNEELGLTGVDVLTNDLVISTDAAKPTHFRFVDEKDTRPPGSPYWQLGAKRPVRSQISIDQETGYDAYGYLNANDHLVGTFRGYVQSRSALGQVRFTFDGDFDMAVRSIVAPPA